MRFNPTVSPVPPAHVPGVFARAGRCFTSSCCEVPTAREGRRTILNLLARLAPAGESL